MSISFYRGVLDNTFHAFTTNGPAVTVGLTAPIITIDRQLKIIAEGSVATESSVGVMLGFLNPDAEMFGGLLRGYNPHQVPEGFILMAFMNIRLRTSTKQITGGFKGYQTFTDSTSSIYLSTARLNHSTITLFFETNAGGSLTVYKVVIGDPTHEINSDTFLYPDSYWDAGQNEIVSFKSFIGPVLTSKGIADAAKDIARDTVDETVATNILTNPEFQNGISEQVTVLAGEEFSNIDNRYCAL